MGSDVDDTTRIQAAFDAVASGSKDTVTIGPVVDV